jgi:hypothetical protein
VGNQFSTFNEFWLFYLKSHNSAMNRFFHFIGTFLGLFFLIYGIFKLSLFYILTSLISGYSFAWIGHFYIEKNRPATFRFPIWSFICDLKMSYLILKKRTLNI